ncbi:elongation factor P [Rickettsia endosymbiont of Cardiosporidium cionae]|uniref:elongation factor P n=1 Tax=Rickettsia endosymbiont of Cardiosporidium cionae TaxID=2777155 RepID=UPI0018958A8A|nr:elongation factor P [Rickettsia endosymbiont of Cardiosporidium cionae]KAF8818339.1 elongation factor P [Rickettsia endosymbiont of Cardiosporidium cionae]
MKILVNDIKSGNVIEYKDSLWIVNKNPEHTKPGKGVAYVQLETKNFYDSKKSHFRFSSGETIDLAFIEKYQMNYLYSDGDFIVLMDPNSFEQVYVKKSFLGKRILLIYDNMSLTVEKYNGEIISVKLPKNIIVTIKYTEPTIKTATVTTSFKTAIINDQINVMVPSYLNSNDKILIKTDDMSFVERVK